MCNYDIIMSVITTISGVPLFSTRREALSWARLNSLTGFHTHTYQGKTGFMGGSTHGQATTTNTPVVRVTTTPTQTSTSTPTSSSSNSGGGY